MSEPVIDPVVFAELQEAAGAEFVTELVGTFFEEAPVMLAEFERLAAELKAFRGFR